MPPTTKRSRKFPKFIAVILSLAWFGLLIFAATQHQAIQDWWRLRSYTAPTAVAMIATQDTMTPYARKVLYVNGPQIESKTAFKQCNQQSEQTIVLGCYRSNQAGIYVLAVSDPRLDGVEQVTIAHEMLHAAYDRLSSKDKDHVDAMLENYYHNDVHDQRILDTIDAYKKSEPDAVVDEMHSIFGTEIAALPSGLEQYYQKYFTNRPAVASFAAKYENEFTGRSNAVKADDQQLDSLKAQITDLKASLQNQVGALDSEQTQLEADKANGNTAAYNAAVPGYNQAVNVYNADANHTRTLIGQYNTLVEQRNAVALEAQQLQAEIGGAPAAIGQ